MADGPEDEQGEPFDVDPRSAYPARIFDYLLGGRDHFAADVEAAHQLYEGLDGGMETARITARAMRSFVVGAVHHLAAEAGLRQFMNLGNVVRVPDNVHEVAQRVAPDSCVVYVVSDALVLAHAHQLRPADPAGRTEFLYSDLRDLPALIRQAGEALDLAQPVALIVSGVLHYVSRVDPYEFLAQLVDPLAPGSYLAVTHAASDLGHGQMLDVARRQEQLEKAMRWPIVPRSHEEVARFLDGLELLDPGLVPLDQWHPPTAPDPGPLAPLPLPWYGALARKPA